ncbi:MAG: cobyric acid synthase [Firmicutes bacterium]|nr:cobyric acid synthase [Bacillota bacterium]
MAKSIMIQGTMSNAGKSIIAAALCRIFKQDGYKAAPFKSQNMALNSYITRDGLEMGRAQVVQAQAAGIEPSVLMNPILLKPTNDKGSQVIVNGEVRSYMRAADYFKYKKELIPEIMSAYNTLSREYDIIVIEGAGSPAEINLKRDDIVNMGMAKMADAPVLLVGDIDRGGVFAQLYGTVMLLDDEEKSRIKATVINKFRGDVEILRPGLDMIENLTGVPVAGVVPYGHFDIDDEDSLSERLENKSAGIIDIAVIRFPRISNFTDFNAFERIDGVSVRYVKSAGELHNPDMIILPGSKNTISDLLWMRENGLEAAVKKSKCPIFGICGGYQMLGNKIIDSGGCEGGGAVRGMEMLPMETRFASEKRRARVSGVFENISGTLKDLCGVEFEGYEIHMGRSELSVPAMTRLSDGSYDGISSGDVYGSYVHGIFDKCAPQITECLCRKKGVSIGDIKNINPDEIREREYDALADMVRKSLDMDLIYKILNREV